MKRQKPTTLIGLDWLVQMSKYKVQLGSIVRVFIDGIQYLGQVVSVDTNSDKQKVKVFNLSLEYEFHFRDLQEVR